ncbi:hypothetical protein, conserved [Leishmania tarentolae]|uniref:Uncharacterized protein n=1 Tax=Leishmania tarentolae TaxID=5689 RepID=A0A640KVW5_LEITA|nr:hypothetical protein, conserved [Leishmania tarentolae]
MSSPPPPRGPLQQAPLRFLSELRSGQEEVEEEHHHQLAQRSSGPEPLPESFSIKGFTKPTVADIYYISSDDNRHDGSWQLGYGEASTKSSSVLFDCHEYDGARDEDAGGIPMVYKQGEIGYSLGSSPPPAEVQAEHAPECDKGGTEEELKKAWSMLSSRQRTSEPRRRTEIGSCNCDLPSHEAVEDRSSGSVSLIPDTDWGRANLGHRELSNARGHPVVSEEEDQGGSSCLTPERSSHERSDYCFGAAVSQRFEHVAQQGFLSRTSRKLVYSNCATMVSPTVADDDVEGSDTAATLVEARTKSGGVHEDQDGVVSPPIVMPLEDVAVSHSTLSAACFAVCDANGASPSAHLHSSALLCRNALQASSALEGTTSPTSSFAEDAKPMPVGDSIAQELGERMALQDAHRRVPPSPSAPSEVECSHAEIENAMLEMEKRLQRHGHHPSVATTDANSDGCVASDNSTPCLRRNENDNPKRDESNCMEAQRAHSSSSFSATHVIATDAVDADSVGCVREEDWLACHQYRQTGVWDAGSFDAHRSRCALGRGTPVRTSAAYTLFSSQLRPPEDRCGRVYELAKAFRSGGSHTAFQVPGGNLLASPPAEDMPVSLGDAMTGSADLAILSLKSKPFSPLQGEGSAARQNQFMASSSQVYYSRSSLRSGAEEPQRCPRLSGPTRPRPSVAERVLSSTTTERVSTAVAALTVEPSESSPSTPFTSHRQRPPPRMLCPPTPSPSPSPSRSNAMDASPAADDNAEKGKESDASLMEQGCFSERAPSAEPQLHPQSSDTNALPGHSLLETCIISLGVEAAKTVPLETSTVSADSATPSPGQMPLWSSLSVPVVPADTVLPAVVSAVATASTADVGGDGGVSDIVPSSSSQTRALEGKHGADMALQREMANREAFLTEPRTAAETSVSPVHTDGPLPPSPSPRYARNESSKPRLHGGDVFDSSVHCVSSTPQHAVVAARDNSRCVGCQCVASRAAFQGSVSPSRAAASSAAPPMLHDGAGEDFHKLPIYPMSFPHSGQSTGRMSLPPSQRDSCCGALSWSTSSAACHGTEADSMGDLATDAAGDMECAQVLAVRQSGSTQKGLSTAGAEGEEHLQVPVRLLSSSAVSPSPARPSTGGASDKARLHYELSMVHLCPGGSGEVCGDRSYDTGTSDEYDEAPLCCDASDLSAAEPAGAVANCPTRQSNSPDGLCVDDDAVGDSDGSREDTEGQTRVKEALDCAEAKCALLRLETASATERAAAAVARAQVREQECAELHALVSHMQAQLAAAQAVLESKTETLRADAGVQVGSCADYLDHIGSSASSLPKSRNRLNTRPSSMPKDTALEEGTVWRRRHDILAQELTTLKGRMAEQLAVLDRLGMQPPFSEELVCAAERRLRHVKVARTSGAVMEISQPDARISETSHTLARSTCVDSAAATAATTAATTKRIQVRIGNKISAILSKRKQNRHREPPVAPADVMATGTADPVAMQSTSVPPVKRHGTAHQSVTLGAKENHYVV